MDDSAIILRYKPYSEKLFIVSIFSQNKGRIDGVIQRSKLSIPQPGDVVTYSVKSRLDNHLGRMKLETKKSNSAIHFSKSLTVYAMQSLLEILYKTLPEKHPYVNLWFKTLETIENFISQKEQLKFYCLFELELIKELGFGLDLKKCALTGTLENLSYISPKTGRAVCENAAQPYISKLFKLPIFFINKESIATQKCLENALKITGHFLTNYAMHTKEMPESRKELLKKISLSSSIL